MLESLKMIMFFLVASSILVLMLVAIGKRVSPIRKNDLAHIRLFLNFILLIAMVWLLNNIIKNFSSTYDEQSVIYLSGALFLIINTILAVSIIEGETIHRGGGEVYYFFITIVALAVINLSFDNPVIKMCSAVSWLLLFIPLITRTTIGSKKLEINVKLYILAILLTIFSLFFVFFKISARPLNEASDYTYYAYIVLFLSGMCVAGIPPFHFAHVDCAEGSNNAVSFLFLSSSPILGGLMLLPLTKFLTTSKKGYIVSSHSLALILGIGLLILWLRAIDQSGVKRTAAYVAQTMSPIFCLTLLFSNSEVLPRQFIIFILFFYLSLSLFVFFSSLDLMNISHKFNFTFEDISGFGRIYKIQSLLFLVAIAVIVGLPSTIGHFIKLSLKPTTKEAIIFSLLIFLSIAIGAACFMRIFVFLYSKRGQSEAFKLVKTPRIFMILAALVLVLGGGVLLFIDNPINN